MIRQLTFDWDSEVTARAEYLRFFFLRMAFSEAPVLLSFVLAVRAEAWIVYLFGLILGALPIALTAPSERSIDSIQARITSAGNPVDLRSALTTSDDG